MAILDINTGKFETETTLDLTEAADGRFFYDRPDVVWNDLTLEQQYVSDATYQIRLLGRELASEAVEVLEVSLRKIDEVIEDHQGWFVMALDVAPNADTRTRQLIENYSFHTGEDVAVLFIPREKITAHSSNPQLYGSGAHVKPVLNLRVQTDADFADQERLGSWYQINVETTPLALVDDIR